MKHKAKPSKYDTEKLKSRLLAYLPEALKHLFPQGKIKGQQFFIGDTTGQPGHSLVVELAGDKAGVWIDFATQERGDILTLWAKAHALDSRNDFPTLLQSIADWLGESLPTPSPKKTVSTPSKPKSLGTPTDEWHYYDAKGNPLACVYRYDTPTGKVYRPWNCTTKQMKAPNPRPLYNQPQLVDAEQIIVVEGEKAAEALIEQGIVATTAMFGANAPIDKTDWSPLRDKKVLVWPDNDATGQHYAQKVIAKLVGTDKQSAYAAEVLLLTIPDNKPDKWDAADAVAEGIVVADWLCQQKTQVITVDSIAASSVSSASAQLSSSSSSTTASDSQDGLMRIAPAQAWLGKPPPREWIIPNWLPKGYVTALYGDGGVGKSLLAQQLMTALATGKSWLGMPVKPRRVYALMCEDDSNELWRRQYAINKHYGITMDQLTRLTLLSRVGCNNLLMTFNGQDAGLTTTFFQQLLADIVASEAEVIILDTAADLFGGNENHRSQVRQFVQNACATIARETQGAVLLCAHPSDAGMARGTGTGGSTAWNNTVRSRWYLTHNREPGSLPHQRTLTRKKANYAAAQDMATLVWEAGAFVRIDGDSATVTRVAGDAKRRKWDTIKQLIVEAAQTQGQLYTQTQFAQHFQHTADLGCASNIKSTLVAMAVHDDLVFTWDGERYGLPPIRKGYGYLCLAGMSIKATDKDGKVSGNVRRAHSLHGCD